MNIPLTIVAFAAALVLVPGASFAQTSNSVHITRAQVIQELADLEAVGYRPVIAPKNNIYPDDIIEAQERLAAKRAAKQNSTAPTQ